MSGAVLSPEDRAHFLRLMRHHTPSPVHRRMNALLLLDDGWAAERVAEVLFIDAETVREHRRLYLASGVAGVERLNYEGTEPSLDAEQLEALGAELDARLYTTAKAVCAFVARSFGVTYTAHAMAKVLKRLGFVYKMPKKVPAKANEDAQREFVADVLGPLMKSANDDTPLYFADGTHPSYTAHAAHGWIRKGETRELKSNQGRQNININGALSWPGREFVHRVELHGTGRRRDVPIRAGRREGLQVDRHGKKHLEPDGSQKEGRLFPSTRPHPRVLQHDPGPGGPRKWQRDVAPMAGGSSVLPDESVARD